MQNLLSVAAISVAGMGNTMANGDCQKGCVMPGGAMVLLANDPGNARQSGVANRLSEGWCRKIVFSPLIMQFDGSLRAGSRTTR